MDQILFEYGVLGVMAVGLAVYGWSERADRKEAQKEMAVRDREHSRELYETLKTMDAFKSLIEGITK